MASPYTSPCMPLVKQHLIAMGLSSFVVRVGGDLYSNGDLQLKDLEGTKKDYKEATDLGIYHRGKLLVRIGVRLHNIYFWGYRDQQWLDSKHYKKAKSKVGDFPYCLPRMYFTVRCQTDRGCKESELFKIVNKNVPHFTFEGFANFQTEELKEWCVWNVREITDLWTKRGFLPLDNDNKLIGDGECYIEENNFGGKYYWFELRDFQSALVAASWINTLWVPPIKPPPKETKAQIGPFVAVANALKKAVVHYENIYDANHPSKKGAALPQQLKKKGTWEWTKEEFVKMARPVVEKVVRDCSRVSYDDEDKYDWDVYTAYVDQEGSIYGGRYGVLEDIYEEMGPEWASDFSYSYAKMHSGPTYEAEVVALLQDVEKKIFNTTLEDDYFSCSLESLVEHILIDKIHTLVDTDQVLEEITMIPQGGCCWIDCWEILEVDDISDKDGWAAQAKIHFDLTGEEMFSHIDGEALCIINLQTRQVGFEIVWVDNADMRTAAD